MNRAPLLARLALVFCATAAASALAAPDPFASNNGQIPPKGEYGGPLFSLSHAYPATVTPVPTPTSWQTAIGNGHITVKNAYAYVEALKAYVAPDMRRMLEDPAHWDAAASGWYNEPWLGGIRESIHGTYVGTDYFPASLFAKSGLKKPFSTYVLTYYDKTAGNTLDKVWGSTAMTPQITPASTQFAEGGIVVKVALTTANADAWPVMKGALQWPLYITTNATTGNHKTPQVDKTSFMQFDLIVKDTQSAPATGWVFATLVYDRNAPGKDAWDKMVPLGAMWGNDPQAGATPHPRVALKENWINPAAPAYAKMTLGWQGRLSGPNDGGRNDAIITVKGAAKKVKNLPSSSCMSCHGVAEWPMKSFLLPTTTLPPKVVDNDYLVMWAPGTPQWLQWFQSRPGSQPQDAGTTAFDYDMVFVFKSLPAWQQAMGKGPTLLDGFQLNGRRVRGLQYNGRPQP